METIKEEDGDMMELALVKTLLSREFYDEHKGVRCPERIFSKDVRKIKQALDTACLLYTSPSPRDGLLARMPSSA